MNARQYYGTWSMHVASWTQVPLPALHVVRYEDLIERTAETFRGVAQFLGLNPPPERLERAISHSSFEQRFNPRRTPRASSSAASTRAFSEAGAWASGAKT
jgi:hypothetical protein